MKATENSEAVRLNNELIKQAFALYDKRQAEAAHEAYIAHEMELPEFSIGFLKRMEKLSRKQKRPRILRSRAFKAAVIVAAVLALLSALAFSVTGIREWLFGLFLEPTQHASYVLYSDPSELRETIETYYEPKYIPEGFEKRLDQSQQDETSYTIVYHQILNNEPNDGLIKRFAVNQATKNVVSTIDTENAGIKRIEFRGTDAIYVHKTYTESVYIHMLIWFEDGYVFSVTLTNTGNYDMLLAIAESVSPVK